MKENTSRPRPYPDHSGKTPVEREINRASLTRPPRITLPILPAEQQRPQPPFPDHKDRHISTIDGDCDPDEDTEETPKTARFQAERMPRE